MTEPRFTISSGASLTPRELRDLHRDGSFVARSAHIGNQYLSNMLIAQIGIPLCLYDRTTYGADKNYHPGTIIRNGTRVELVENHDTVVVPFGSFRSGVRYRGNPARYHVATLSGLFPGLVQTESALLLQYEEKIAAIMDGLARYGSLFDRRVLADGSLYSERQYNPPPVRGSDVVELLRSLRDAVYGESAPVRGGPIPDLELVVVIMTLLGHWKTGRTTIYELSGPDMIRYALTGSFLERVQRAWNLLHLSSTLPEDDLPRALELVIVPTADFRFGYVGNSRRGARTLEIIAEILDLHAKKRSALSGVGENRSTLARPMNNAIESLSRELTDCAWDIFYDVKDGNFFSHHDLRAAEAPLVIPQRYLSMSFGEMGRMVSKLRAILRV